jgi:hypothetical protein
VVGVGSYLLSTLLLALLGLSLGFCAFRIRGHIFPAWSGAPARLVELVVAVALLIGTAELLGLFGLLYASTLTIGALLLAIGVFAWRIGAPSAAGAGEEGGPPAPSAPKGMTAVALVVVFVVFAHWGLAAKASLENGIFNFDSLWYHMPFAAGIAQSHSVTGFQLTDTVYTNWFYAQNSELLHAVGILFTHRDTLSIFINFGWLAAAFLAAWCIGRPFGRGPLCVIAAAIVFESPTLIELEPGQAKNDIMAIALILAAVAILLNVWQANRRSLPVGWALSVVGLAAGLAVGTRITTLGLIAALGCAVVALAPAGRRWAALGWWSGGALAGGGFWYLRNLVAVGNPIPQVESLGPLSLPHPEQLQSGRPNFTIAHYLTNGSIWHDYFFPGLEFTVGELWPLLFAAAFVGALLALAASSDRAIRWLGAVVLTGVLAYLVTPFSAGGPEGDPIEFIYNVRFVLPALLVGLLLLMLTGWLKRPALQWALAAGLLVVLALNDDPAHLLHDSNRGFALLVALFAVGLPVLIALARRWGASSRIVIAGCAGLILLVVGLGYPLQRDYLQDRYGPQSWIPGYEVNTAYAWAQGVSDARIGLAGTVAGIQSYGFYGRDLSNRVLYLGERGPHGAFNPVATCAGFRAAVNADRLDYLVTSPFLDFLVAGRLLTSPEARWLDDSPGVEAIGDSSTVTVWRVKGRLDPGACGPANAPLREIPEKPEASESTSSETSAPRTVTPAELRNAEATLGQPIYWVGPLEGRELELTELSEGGVQVLYVPKGTEASEVAAKSLTIGSYPLPDPAAAVEGYARGKGSRVFHSKDGREVVTSAQAPTSAFFANPENSVQVEVYDPSPRRALGLAQSGRVVPVP